MSWTQRLVLSWLLDALALGVAAALFADVSGSAGAIILAALVFGLLSATVKPLLKLLTLPLALLTFGIAWFFVAMFILWLTSRIVGGFEIDGFFTLVGATFVVWAVGVLGGIWLGPRRKKKNSA